MVIENSSQPEVVYARPGVLATIFVLIVAASIFAAFVRFFILRDYSIESQIPCDPYTEACFAYHCDPTAEECTGDEFADTSYYKLIERSASNIPSCDPADESCRALMCDEGEPECALVLCDGSDPAVECTDPEVFASEHPLEDSSESTESVPVEEGGNGEEVSVPTEMTTTESVAE